MASDIVPILIDRDGHIKLCDFGIYSVFEWPEDKKMGTMSEAIDYKSPEQVRSEDFDFLSDLWQLVSSAHPRASACTKCSLDALPS